MDIYSAYIISTYLKSGALWYTLFITSFPLGSIVSGFYIAWRTRRIEIDKFFVFLMIPYAILLLFMSVSTNASEVVISALLLGVISSFITIKITTYITSVTPSEVIGRVNAVYYTLIASNAPVLAFVYSFLGTLFSPMKIICYTGVMVLILVTPTYIYLNQRHSRLV